MIEPVARLRIELQEIEPKVFRRVDVPLTSTLLTLHEIIQITFDWWDYHLFEFEVRDRVYGEPMANDDLLDRRVYRAAGVRLRTLIDRGVERFLYVYDFGTTGGTTSSSNRSVTARPTSSTRRWSTGSGAVHRRTSVASRASWSSWKPCWIRSTRITNRWSPGTGNRSTRATSTNGGRGSGCPRWPPAAGAH